MARDRRVRALGVRIDDGGRGLLPDDRRRRGRGRGRPGHAEPSSSSQLVSGLLLSGGPRFGKGLEVRHGGRRCRPPSHLAMTVAMLRAGRGHRGDRPEPVAGRAGPLRGGELTIEPDLSNARKFLAAGW